MCKDFQRNSGEDGDTNIYTNFRLDPNDCRNLTVGDVVLLKDQDSPRNLWPIGLVERTFPSSEGKVRKVEVAVMRDGKRTTYVRPLSEFVTLLEVD